MARGFSSAPGASAEWVEASASELEKSRMLVLGTSRNGLVRAAIAERKDCPFGLMVTLAHDYSVDVRSAVAANPRAQRSVLQYLAADRSLPVILALVENPALPQDVLEELAFHKKSEVRAAATRRIDTGMPGATDAHAEDEHTPEIADHVSLAVDVDGEWALGGGVWSTPAGDVAGTFVSATVPPPALDDAVVAPSAAPRVSQFFSPSLDQEGGIATRTAPVRGFRAPEQ